MHYRVVLQKIATCTLQFILLFCCVGSVSGRCKGRCENNQYCDDSTGACESCGIYCDPKNSPFANERDCNEKCPYVIYDTNQTRACPFPCEPGFFCVKYLESCESCEIFCNPDNQYAEKCPESCLVASSSPSPEIGITTKRDVTNTNKTTLAPIRTDGKQKNNVIIILCVTVGFFIAISLIFLIIHLLKKYCGKQTHYPIQVQTDPVVESNEQELVLV